jgi:hypothetical protein
MNKDELKNKAERLKERMKEAYGDTKKKAAESIDHAREHGHKSDKVESGNVESGNIEREVVERDTLAEDEDE